MCEVHHVMGIVTTYGLTVVLAGSLASISAAGRLCEVSICVLLSLDYFVCVCALVYKFSFSKP